MAVSVTLEEILLPPSGIVYVNFSDGTQLEYANRAALETAVADVGDTDWLRLALIKHWLLQNPALDNPAKVTGKTMQLDLSVELGPMQIGKV